MKLGSLTFTQLEANDKRVAVPVLEAASKYKIQDDVFVANIDPSLADTAAFCENYQVDEAISTNCLVIESKRAGEISYNACLVMAGDMADVNGAVRKDLGARKVSFAAKDIALELTGMEYGGITPVGLPSDWTLLIDESVMNHEFIVIGSGLRSSKVALRTKALSNLPAARVLNIKR